MAQSKTRRRLRLACCGNSSALRRMLCLLLVVIATAPARAEPPGQRFVAISFHDVVDQPGDLGADAVTTRTFVQFLDWLKGTGWTPVSLDDVSAAARGQRRLPDKAITADLRRRQSKPLHACLPAAEGLSLPGRGCAGRKLDGGSGRRHPCSTAIGRCRVRISFPGTRRGRCKRLASSSSLPTATTYIAPSGPIRRAT